MTGIKSTPIHIVIIDTKANYQKRIDEKLFEPDPFFASHESFETAADLERYLKSFQDKSAFVLIYVHAFRTVEHWAVKLEATIDDIKDRFAHRINIKIVTSDAPQIVKEKFPGYDVDRYNDITRKANNGNYNPQTVGDILGNESEDEVKVIQPAQNFIFISHASKDKKIVDLFVEKLLILGLNCNSSHIFYTSSYSLSLATGENIPNGLKKALVDMTIFIQFISTSYRESEVCLNEMGAAWFKLDSRSIITLLLPHTSLTQIGFLNAQNVGIDMTDKEKMYKLFDDFNSCFKIYQPKAGEFAKRLDEFSNDLLSLS